MKIILKGNPKSNNHIYRNHGHIRYMTQDGKALKESYQLQAKSQVERKWLPTPNDLGIQIDLFFGDQRKRDIDNYCKILLDSLSGLIWIDDNQITCMAITKQIDKVDPRIEITI